MANYSSKFKGAEIDKRLTAVENKADKSIVDSQISTLNSEIDGKVDKIEGKQLSANDYTNEEKAKLSGLENYDDTEVKTDIADVSLQTSINRSTLGYQRKNLLKITVPPKNVNGITFSLNNGVVSLSGTATKTFDSYFPEYQYSVTEADSWVHITEKSIISCYGTLNSLVLAYYNPDAEHIYSNIIYKTINNNKPFTLEKGSIIIGLYMALKSGTDYTGKDLSFMLRCAEIADDTYEPYKPSVEERLDGLKFKHISETEYESLEVKDSGTVYFIS